MSIIDSHGFNFPVARIKSARQQAKTEKTNAENNKPAEIGNRFDKNSIESGSVVIRSFDSAGKYMSDTVSKLLESKETASEIHSASYRLMDVIVDHEA